MRILVVEDDPFLRSFILTIIKREGNHEVFEVPGGYEALGVIEEKPFWFNLVISDNSMPRMTGVELIRRLRTKRKCRRTKFALITGDADRELIQLAAREKLNGFLIKPFEPLALTQLVKKLEPKLPEPQQLPTAESLCKQLGLEETDLAALLETLANEVEQAKSDLEAAIDTDRYDGLQFRLLSVRSASLTVGAQGIANASRTGLRLITERQNGELPSVNEFESVLLQFESEIGQLRMLKATLAP